MVYDIEVDSDHSFLLACGLVAHNCEFCESAAAEYENKVVPLEAPFYRKGSTITGTDGGTMALDFTDIDGPPLHPNDRCALVPEVRLA